MKPPIVEGTAKFGTFKEFTTQIQDLISKIETERQIESEYYLKITYPCINTILFFLCANSKLLKTKQSKGVISTIEQMTPLLNRIVAKNDQGIYDMVEHLKCCENWLDEFLQGISKNQKAKSLFTDKYAKSVLSEGNVELLAPDGSHPITNDVRPNKLYLFKRQGYMILAAYRLHPSKLAVNPFTQSNQKKQLTQMSEQKYQSLTPKGQNKAGSHQRKLFDSSSEQDVGQGILGGKLNSSKDQKQKKPFTIITTSSVIFEDKTIQGKAGQRFDGQNEKIESDFHQDIQAISPIHKRMYTQENSPLPKQLRRSLSSQQKPVSSSRRKLPNIENFSKKLYESDQQFQRTEETLQENTPPEEKNLDATVQKYRYLEQIILVLLIILMGVELFFPFIGDLLAPFRDSSAPQTPIFVRIVDFMNR